jgi:transposase
VLALEDLRINGMVRNHSLSKSILDASWGYLKQRLIDKALCDYNGETTPPNNLECKAVEKKHVTEF